VSALVDCPDCGPTSKVWLSPRLFLEVDLDAPDRGTGLVSVSGFDDDTDPERPDSVLPVQCHCGLGEEDGVRVTDRSALLALVGGWVLRLSSEPIKDADAEFYRRKGPFV
jgi:hypothetical protein